MIDPTPIIINLQSSCIDCVCKDPKMDIVYQIKSISIFDDDRKYFEPQLQRYLSLGTLADFAMKVIISFSRQQQNNMKVHYILSTYAVYTVCHLK